ncbi:DUF6440 family protein [Bacillus sp. MUM 13]|uniref:DUF6440 family protein n=1 Tax=Bacillus sp. MUM 13 TaxID=1678001 RepID=UPI0008F5C2C0|nr:DUF6440 family protein [Bacillus sp. MUM 13]OIK10041.1 xylan 1,4-beta-xylosidase [Bacillus sp. MUM 13]
MAKDKRFEITYTQGTLNLIQILKDRETGVQYLQSVSGGGTGLTVLVDSEGKPILSK